MYSLQMAPPKHKTACDVIRWRKRMEHELMQHSSRKYPPAEGMIIAEHAEHEYTNKKSNVAQLLCKMLQGPSTSLRIHITVNCQHSNYTCKTLMLKQRGHLHFLAPTIASDLDAKQATKMSSFTG
jgi:hypothetical protein